MPNDNLIELQIYSIYFKAIANGEKTFEVRKRFKGKKGDTILFIAIDKKTKLRTGMRMRKTVGEVFEFPNWYIKNCEPFKVISLV